MIKDMEKPTDCKKCPFMGTDGNPKDLLNPMMCIAIWATTHEIKHCIGGKVRDDCPLVEIKQSEDCVGRDAVEFMITGGRYPNEDCEQFIDRLVKELEVLPPVTPTQLIANIKIDKDELREICEERIEIACQHGTCKDCSKNMGLCLKFLKKVADDFYCADFEGESNNG